MSRLFSGRSALGVAVGLFAATACDAGEVSRTFQRDTVGGQGTVMCAVTMTTVTPRQGGAPDVETVEIETGAAVFRLGKWEYTIIL